MTYEEYLEGLRRLNIQHQKKTKDLATRYLLSEDAPAIGDTIQIGRSKGVVYEYIVSTLNVEKPDLIYFCNNRKSKKCDHCFLLSEVREEQRKGKVAWTRSK